MALIEHYRYPKMHVKNLPTLFVVICILLIFVKSIALGQDTPIELHVGLDSVDDAKLGIRFVVIKKRGGNDSLMCRLDGREVAITESGKPNFEIYHADKDVIIVLKPVGFCCPAGVFQINKSDNSVTTLFESEDKRSVDYVYKGFDKKEGKITLWKYENNTYSESSSPARLLGIEYVYTN